MWDFPFLLPPLTLLLQLCPPWPSLSSYDSWGVAFTSWKGSWPCRHISLKLLASGFCSLVYLLCKHSPHFSWGGGGVSQMASSLQTVLGPGKGLVWSVLLPPSLSQPFLCYSIYTLVLMFWKTPCRPSPRDYWSSFHLGCFNPGYPCVPPHYFGVSIKCQLIYDTFSELHMKE